MWKKEEESQGYEDHQVVSSLTNSDGGVGVEGVVGCEEVQLQQQPPPFLWVAPPPPFPSCLVLPRLLLTVLYYLPF